MILKNGVQSRGFRGQKNTDIQETEGGKRDNDWERLCLPHSFLRWTMEVPV